ncbi:hypothetical protein ACWD7V_12065, partial [Streptomyces sp. NPDC005143]
MPGDKKAFPADRSIVIIAMALGALAGLNLDRDEAFESDARAASVGDCLQSSGLKAGSRDEGLEALSLGTSRHVRDQEPDKSRNRYGQGRGTP